MRDQLFLLFLLHCDLSLQNTLRLMHVDFSMQVWGTGDQLEQSEYPDAALELGLANQVEELDVRTIHVLD